MIDTDAMLIRRLHDLNRSYARRNDAIFHASLTITKELLRLVAVACDAEGISEQQATQIIDRVIIGSIGSPAYTVALSERDDLRNRLIEQMSMQTQTFLSQRVGD